MLNAQCFGQEAAMMMVRKSKGLGERHQKILDFLSEYQRENRYPPSIREIGERTGIFLTS
jgi:repressor LexA